MTTITMNNLNGDTAAIQALQDVPADLAGQTVTVNAADAYTCTPGYADTLVHGLLVERGAAHLVINEMQPQPAAVFQLAGEKHNVMDRLHGTVAAKTNAHIIG